MIRIHIPKPASVLVLLCLIVTGCGPSVGSVEGKVTFAGKAVVYGTVVIVGADGLPKSGAISSDGTYRVDGVGVGEAKIAVSSPPPPTSQQKGKGDVGGRDADASEKVPPTQAATTPIQGWVAIPMAFGEPSTSGLKVTVVGATTTHNIELK
jgi:hypothetical protein